jgi:hypothetical protein
MKGIELSKSFYEQFGKQMIENEFREFKDRIAVGLVGHGSECFGYDDVISQDHDFGPSLCIWITEEDEKRVGFRLFRAYSKLVKEHGTMISSPQNTVGESGRGVMSISEFYRQYIGENSIPLTLSDWLYIPSYYLAEATNGEVFYDPLRQFSAVREYIKSGMPEDARLKRMASCAFYMAQAGQYNYERCLKHNEIGAARLALDEFAKNAVELVFWINRSYMPYYKWAFRAMRELPLLADVSDLIEKLVIHPTDDTSMIISMIERICALIAYGMRSIDIVASNAEYFEAYAYEINSKIKNADIRNMPVML